jgi:hypothetical protein
MQAPIIQERVPECGVTKWPAIYGMRCRDEGITVADWNECLLIAIRTPA